jgi:hypothetical protein
VRLKPTVLADLAAHGVEPGEEDSPETLRERLNDAYLVEVRRLRERQRSGEIPLREFGSHVQALKERYPLLGLPLDRWAD